MSLIPDISLETANAIYAWGWRASVVGALVTAAALVFLFWGTRVRDHDTEQQLGQLNLSAANANERAAKLEKEAAGLRLELDREIQKRAQRILSEEKKEILASELRGKISEMNVVVQKDWETNAYALQIEIAFSKASITIHPYELPPGDIVPAVAGIVMYSPAISKNGIALEKDPLYAALKKVGLFGGTASRPFSTFELSGNPPELPLDIYTVYIGQKSPW